MTEHRSPHEVVLALVQVINDEVPRRAAEEILDPMVKIHMDAANHRGIEIWYKWIHLIRNCGRITNLCMTRCDAKPDPESPHIVELLARWEGTGRSNRAHSVAERDIHLRYLVRNGRILEIWTHKSNYVFIFGRWIGYSIGYRLYLAWAIAYFALLSFRGEDLRVDRPAILKRSVP
jgi:hypothetical protein